MEKLIGQPIVLMSGKHPGFFDIYEYEPAKYRAVPRNKWDKGMAAADYQEFTFWKEGRKWESSPAVYDKILEQIVEECGL